MVARKVFLFCSVFSLMLAGTSFAKAEDDVENNEGLLSSIEQPAVLFKIHDVKPLRDRDGNVTDCEFGVTFYNRTNSDVNKIAMDLTWTDEVVGNVIQMEKNADMLKKQREMYAQVNTEKAWQGDYHGTQTAATQKQAAKPTKKADSKAATKEAQPSKRSEQQNEQANKPAKKEKGSWWGALFGGRYPGESDESFRFRLEMRTYPAAQPFK